MTRTILAAALTAGLTGAAWAGTARWGDLTPEQQSAFGNNLVRWGDMTPEQRAAFWGGVTTPRHK